MRILSLLAISTVLATTLSACGGSGTPTAPVAAPTELAAVDHRPPRSIRSNWPAPASAACPP